MKKLLLTLAVLATVVSTSAEDYIFYQTTNEGFAHINNSDAFGAKITMHYRKNGINKIEFDGTVTSIGDRAFQYSKNLYSIDIPFTVKYIGEQAFGGCESLSSIYIPYAVETIEEGAFANCTSLRSFDGNFASEDNSMLIFDEVLVAFAPVFKTSLEIPNTIKRIGNSVFVNCSGLKSVVIPNSVKSIGDDSFIRCNGLTSVDIPNSVLTIGNFAFEECTGLTSLNIGNSVKTIGFCAFQSCSGLKSLVIPNSVTTIGGHAFGVCHSLTTVEISNSVTTIGEGAFAYCYRLSEIYSRNPTPPSACSDTFDGVDKSSCVLKVPESAVEAYKAAEVWKDFYNIVGIPDDDITGVDSVVTEESGKAGKVFNLHGVEVKEGFKGIVIEDGKKVLKR